MKATAAIIKAPFDKGSMIFYQGDPGDAMYIVERGAVQIFKESAGERVELCVLGDGEMFGEMALIDGSPRMASAVALENCVVMKFPRDVLESKLSKMDPFLQALLNILVANLRGVHEIYMRRPRSIDDHIHAISHNLVGFRDRLNPINDADIRQRARKHIDAMSDAALGLMEVFRDYDGSADSVPTEADLRK